MFVRCDNAFGDEMKGGKHNIFTSNSQYNYMNKDNLKAEDNDVYKN